MAYKINHADILDWAKNYDGPLFDGVLCDPPYHLTSIVKRFGKEDSAPAQWGTDGAFARASKGFMGMTWDGGDIAFNPETWAAIYKVLKPGAHLLAFSGSRTYHRMACAIEDAGFEIRDMIEWVYGSGFPKSLNIGKAVDKIQGNEREVTGETRIGKTSLGENSNWDTSDNMKAIKETGKVNITKGNSDWEGYGTALKPAHEPCVLARKPIKGTVANNCLEYGTGGLNIDGSRVGTEILPAEKGEAKSNGKYGDRVWDIPERTGRFPANLIHDGSDEVLKVFPDTKSQGHWSKTKVSGFGDFGGGKSEYQGVGNKAQDSGSAARFFYTAKASKSERNAGLEGFEEKRMATDEVMKERLGSNWENINRPHIRATPRANYHPTVKPLALTKYLANLIKPPKGGRLLVPFSGSGSEMIGALQAGWEYVEGVELTEEYIPIAEARIKHWLDKIDKQMEML